MNKIERTVLDGELPQSLLDDTAKIRNRVIFRGRKLIRNALKKGEAARKGMIVEPLEQLAKDLHAGKIDQAQFAVKYSQLVTAYKNYTRPMWDKANDDFVRIISAGMERIQRQSNIFEEPLSQELMGKLARVEAIMKNVKATFREQFLGDWLDDATKLTDEIGKWQEWSLAKIDPTAVAMSDAQNILARFPAEMQARVKEIKHVPGLKDVSWEHSTGIMRLDLSRSQSEIYGDTAHELAHAVLGKDPQVGLYARWVKFLQGKGIETHPTKMQENFAEAVRKLFMERYRLEDDVIEFLRKEGFTGELQGGPWFRGAPLARPAAETRSTVARLIEQFSGRWQQIIDGGVDEGIQYSKDSSSTTANRWLLRRRPVGGSPSFTGRYSTHFIG